MGWPSRQEYREALQACDIAFTDPELKSAVALSDNLGMPRAYSGQNATVFQMRSGSRTWAVKCFAHESPDQQRRYAAISSHLERVKLPYTVAFQYLQQGINVSGVWYPVLKMEWVEGESLKRYIERNLGDGAALRHLGLRVLQMVKKLQAVGIAHGDLQHGNVLVCGQDLRLVDYDGMFVPALTGSLSTELGHQNYQHPNRSPAHFSAALDSFSAWVIFLSLYAASVLPDLWDSTGRLEECLVFRRKDFEAPYASQVIKRVAAAPDPVLQQLALRFQVLLYSSPDEATLPDVQSAPPPAAATPRVSRSAASWIDDHRSPTVAAPVPAAPASVEPDSTWLVGWVKKPGQPAALRNPIELERAAGVTTLILGAGLVFFREGLDGYFAASVLSLCTANLVLLKMRYEAEPDVGRLMTLADEERVLARHIGIRLHSVQATEDAKARRQRKTADDVARLRNQEAVLRAREVEEVNQFHAVRAKRLQELATRRAKLDLEEAQELARSRQPSQARTQALDQKLAALQVAEADELSRALKSHQAQHVQNYLRGSLLERATISGIGFKLTERLIASGFRTAADIEYHRVLGVERIGPQLATALVAWRKDAERAAARNMPTVLPHADDAAIRNRYAAQIHNVMAERSREIAELQRNEQAVRAKYAAARAELPKQEEQAKNAADTDVRDTHARYAQRYAELADNIRAAELAGTAQVDEIQPQLAKLQKDLAALRWKREMLRLERDQMTAVSFGSYLRRILGA